MKMDESMVLESIADNDNIDDDDDIDVSGVGLTTASEWAQRGSDFHPSTRADKVKRLPPGVYRYSVAMHGWWLERTSAKFEFPFKVYDAGTNEINRVKTFWKNNEGNLGVLMNGLRGAGKTMNAQRLSNDLIEEEDLPVLVVRGPIPLQIIFDSVQQNMIVIFDEFEKTHNDKHQQQLLSTIDGMSRSSHKRLIIFTTNKTQINENLKDRPSRIHYCFEFRRVADEIIEGLINDSLPEDLLHFKPDIFEFLNNRKICTIDIVKAVIAEVATFRESPLEFEDLLNIAKGEPPAYTISILSDKNVAIGTFAHYFRLNGGYDRYAAMLSGNKRSIQSFIDKGRSVRLQSQTWDGYYEINLLEKCEEEFCWLAHLTGPRSKTIFKDFDFLSNYQLGFDNPPKDWDFPFTKDMARNDPDAQVAIKKIWAKSLDYGTVYGTGDMAIFKIRIDPNHDTNAPSRYQVTGSANVFGFGVD